MSKISDALRLYLVSHSTNHLTRWRSEGVSSPLFRPWWRKYWQVACLTGERSKVSGHWVFGIRPPHSSAKREGAGEQWTSGPATDMVRALCCAVRDHQDPLIRLCWILPNGREAFTGPLPAFANVSTYFPSFGVEAQYQQQSIQF